jgi:hypothetical protein
MKNIKIKNFHIPTFLLETLQLENEINALGELTQHLEQKMEKLKEQSQMFDIMNEAIKQLRIIIPNAYPKEAATSVIQSMMNDLDIKNFESYREFKFELIELFFRLFFSEGEDKIFDTSDSDFFDGKKMDALIAQKIDIPDQWLNQFILCINVKHPNEDMILHTITPEWLWPKCFRLLLELYKITEESIKNTNH